MTNTGIRVTTIACDDCNDDFTVLGTVGTDTAYAEYCPSCGSDWPETERGEI